MESTRDEEEMMDTTFRQRDWDYLGFRYSVLSSIATGGWNNVMDMIPGRDLAEFQNFSEQDKKWIRDWIDWTSEHKEFLRNTQTILGQPALGKVDGTSAIVNDHGYVFLFNPNYKKLDAHFTLDGSIGLKSGKKFILRELYARRGNLIGAPHTGIWSYGEPVRIAMDGTSAMVIEILPAEPAEATPIVFNGGEKAQAAVNGTQLEVSKVFGEPGTESEIGILLPSDTKVSAVTVGGSAVSFTQVGNHVSIAKKFEGARFSEAQQITLKPTAGGAMSGMFTIPTRIVSELKAREKQWPIPWTDEDLKTTWLAPQRLLLFLQIAEPSDKWEPTLTIDGRAIELQKGYSSVRVHSESFVGFYADVSALAPDVTHRITVKLPALKPGQFQGVFFDNVAARAFWNRRTARFAPLIRRLVRSNVHCGNSRKSRPE